MHRLTVHYGVPDDQAAFDQRYLDEHVPMVADIPGVQAFTWSRVQPLGGEATVYQVAELDFPDEETMTAGLRSEGGGAAAKHAASLGASVQMFVGEVREA